MNATEKKIQQIRESAESMSAAETEVIGTASFGDVVRQGDVQLVCMESKPNGKKKSDKQLAPGTSQGSRHEATGRCTVLECDPAVVAAQINRLVKGATVDPALVGPVVVCNDATTITHPEHGWKILPEGTVWGVVFQREHAEQIRRVQD